MFTDVSKTRGKSLDILPKDYVVMDIETTGLSPDFDEIIELSALKYENHNLVGMFSELIKPRRDIPAFITELTGISNEMVKDSPSIGQVLESFEDFLYPGCIIMGYNVRFDIDFVHNGMLRELGHGFTYDYVDVLKLARRVEKGLPNHKLQTLAEHYNIRTTHHRANADCDTTYKCYLKLMEKLC